MTKKNKCKHCESVTPETAGMCYGCLKTRDGFAQAALTGLLAGPYSQPNMPSASAYAKEVFYIADAMMEWRKQ
jgi:hypothetical protein